MCTLAQYEVAWNMHQARSTMEQIQHVSYCGGQRPGAGAAEPRTPTCVIYETILRLH